VEGTPFVRPEGPAARWLRRAGLWILLLGSLLPYHGCRAHPNEYLDPPGEGNGNYSREHEGNRGVRAAEWMVRAKLLRLEDPEPVIFGGDGHSDDMVGVWVFLALPFWAAALLLARRSGDRTRRVAALLLWSGAAILFAAVAVGSGPILDPLAPPWFGMSPQVLVTLAIGGLLLLARPPSRRSLADVESVVSVQALVGIEACLFTPVLQTWSWCVDDGFPFQAALRAQAVNYRAGFWLALLGLACVAAPLYFSGPSLRRRYDRPSPWPSNSSTPTPTSTSTGSTPTGGRSSDGPGPPGSSPS
jgi:hypothetical protein